MLGPGELTEPDIYSDLGGGEHVWEPNDEESRQVLNALCQHEPSSVDRQDLSRLPGRLTGFDLGAGGRRFESGHPDNVMSRDIGDRCLGTS